MSHFTVLVIGDNFEEQLAPYDEGIEVEKYQVGEVTDEDKQRMLDFYIKEGKIKNGTTLSYFDEYYDKFGDEWNGGNYKKIDGKWISVSTYNPKSKWDWYQIGGRWTGFFKVKEGLNVLTEVGTPGLMTKEANPGFADRLQKKFVDFDGMFDEAKNQASKEYDDVVSKFGDSPEAESWDSVIDRFGPDNIDDARKFYHDQPRVKTFLFKDSWHSKVEDYQISKAKFVQLAKENVAVPYAFVKDGEWIQKGDMGWFGMSSNEKDQDEWNAEFHTMLDSLPGETLLTLVDCHI